MGNRSEKLLECRLEILVHHRDEVPTRGGFLLPWYSCLLTHLASLLWKKQLMPMLHHRLLIVRSCNVIVLDHIRVAFLKFMLRMAYCGRCSCSFLFSANIDDWDISMHASVACTFNFQCSVVLVPNV